MEEEGKAQRDGEGTEKDSVNEDDAGWGLE